MDEHARAATLPTIAAIGVMLSQSALSAAAFVGTAIGSAFAQWLTVERGRTSLELQERIKAQRLELQELESRIALTSSRS